MNDELAGQSSPNAPPSRSGANSPDVGAGPAERGPEHGLRGRASGDAPAGGTSSPPDATRYLETIRGILSYRELAPLLAERVGNVEAQIVSGAYASRPLHASLLLDLHRGICDDLTPDWAGQWRKIEVTVGTHQAPPPFQIAGLVREYFLDLDARWADAAHREDDLFLEMLAFAEGRLLSIHPFPDFNGRAVRLFLRELLRRLQIIGVSLAPQAPDERDAYLTALRAADRNDYCPLAEIWKNRLLNPNLGGMPPLP